MPTRSGKEYLISHECQSCPPSQRYYSNKKFNYKCSDCWKYCEKNGIMTNKEFVQKCRTWARKNTVQWPLKKFILKKKYISDVQLFYLLSGIFVNEKKYISADIGLQLYNARPSENRGHIIGSFISDWWEIKSSGVSTDKKWPSFMACYYGNYNESIESWSGINSGVSIPPKLPLGFKNSFINKYLN